MAFMTALLLRVECAVDVEDWRNNDSTSPTPHRYPASDSIAIVQAIRGTRGLG
jgi:hypothetical protein